MTPAAMPWKTAPAFLAEDGRRLRQWIGGVWREGRGAGHTVVWTPAAAVPIGHVQHASVDDLDEALCAAAKAQPAWRATAPLDRSRVLRRAALWVESRSDAIAQAITAEQGKLLAEARSEVARAVEVFEWYAEEGRRAYGRVVPGDPRHRMTVLREPVGPVAAFTPWNFPVVTPARKVAGALAAGCVCIIKPSEETPSACLYLAQALEESGLPAGVLQVVMGDPAEVSARLVASPVIRKLSFTGSTAVGKQMAALAAGGVKRLTMELGGHAPVLVLDDADAIAAARLSAQTKHRNAGQICVSPTRFLVARGLYRRFVDAYVDVARNLRVGDGALSTSQMGPLANPRRLAAVERLVADARGRGARVLFGGNRLESEGWFHAPTVVTEADMHCALLNEEPFGPVATIAPFDRIEDAIVEANRLPYGLAAYAFTHDARAMLRLSNELETGMLSFNAFAVSSPETPFGGVKESGYGSEGGIEGLDSYLTTKFVHQC